MDAIWRAVATIQEKLLGFYESLQNIIATLAMVQADVARNTSVLKEVHAICIEMSEGVEEKNLIPFQTNVERTKHLRP